MALKFGVTNTYNVRYAHRNTECDFDYFACFVYCSFFFVARFGFGKR